MVLTKAQMKEVITKSLDKDSSYISTMLDALRLPAVSVMEPERFAAFVAGVGRRFEEGDPNVNLTSVRNYVVQLLATEDFQHKYTGNATKPVEELPRTESGALLTNGAEPTTGTPIDSLQMLETVIGCALYPSDFDIANPPGAIIRAVTEMKKRNDEALKVWNEQLSATPGVLRFSRQAIVALVRGAAENLHVTPGALRSYINANLIEVDAKPAQQNTETVQQTGAEVQHAASNPGEKDEVVTEFETERCAWLRAEIRAALAGTTGVMDESDVTELTASVGEDISHSYIARLLAKEIEPCDPFNQLVDDDVHHLTCDILENWQDKKAPRVAYIYSRVEFYLQEARRVSEQKCQEMAADIDGADSTALQQENPEPTRVNASNEDKKTEVEQHPGELSSMGGGRFDVSELFEASPLAKVDDAPRREEPAAPAYFEPGRYLDIPNEVYHSANGISSTMAKDARISLMYYHGRHVIKTIQRERTDALTFGSLVHALALEPEKLDKEFSVEPVIPEGAFTDTASMRAFIEQHNATLPKQADADTLRAVIEKHNATLPAPYALGGNADEIGQFYMMLPPEFQSIPEGAKITATAMKACIKEYNTTLPAPLKTTGGRDALLEQLATIEPEFVEKERSIPAPLPVSGSKEEMAARIKTILPTAVFADEVISAWKNSNDQRQPITQAQMKHAKAIQHALLSHPKAGQWLQHPQRATEVSYFGIDEETGLEVRVRPDLEIDTGARRIAVDLKTVSLPNVKQDNLRYRLHREIIERDYHMSASMYCDVGMFDQFFWIFVNKEPGYHWVAVVETSADELALGRAIYKQQLAAIRNAMDTGIWPEPITEVFTDTLTDYELSRLKELNGEPS
nr:PD-(D/E)XK nuclease-like domain-containing protein [Serratia sp. PAMC26656]